MMPMTGLEKRTNRLENSGIFPSGFTAELMVFMPNIRMENPSKILPAFFFFSVLPAIRRTMPAIARTGEKVSGLKSVRMVCPSSIPARLKSHDVIVVPILAPIIMPTACSNCISPELTKPTTITVVAEEDCITAVIQAPSRTPFKGLFVILASNASILLPEAFARASPRRCMPYRKKARPPIIVNKSDIFILSPVRLFLQTFFILKRI